jgi:hypothetical protein
VLGIACFARRHGANGHLDNLIDICRARGVPLLTAICVNQRSVETGELTKESLARFIKAAQRLGYTVSDEQAFCRSVSKNALNGWANDVVIGDGETSIRGSHSRHRPASVQLAALAAESAHRMTGVASLILLTNIGDQHLRAPYLYFEGGDQRVFRLNDDVLRFPLKFKTDRELHLCYPA